MLSEKAEDNDSIQQIQELLQKQRKHIHTLQHRLREVTHQHVAMSEQYHQFVASNKWKMQQLRGVY